MKNKRLMNIVEKAIRMQLGGGNICPTLTAGEPEIYFFEGVIDE